MDEIKLALEMNKLVHNECKDVPHDIGLKLLEIVKKHIGEQLNLPPVSNNEVAVCSPCDDIKCTSRYSLFCKTKCEDRIKQTDC